MYFEAYLLTISIVMMVFVLRMDTKEELRPKLQGEGTSVGVTIKLEISVPLVTQGICDLLAGGRRNELTA